MTAPALVALAHGSRDPRSAQTIKALVAEVRGMRPDLRVEPAFLELAKPSFATVVDRLVKAGYDEIVVVPLLLTEAYHAKVDVPAAVAEAAARHDEPRDPGHRTCSAWSRCSSRCWTGGCAPRSATPGSASSTRSCSPRPAPRTSSPTRRSPGSPGCGAPSTGCPPWRPSPRPLPRRPARPSASSGAEGRRHIAVGSLFLAPGLLPDRAAELALEAGAVAVSEPLGADPRWPARSWRATPSAPSSSSRSEWARGYGEVAPTTLAVPLRSVVVTGWKLWSSRVVRRPAAHRGSEVSANRKWMPSHTRASITSWRTASPES